MGVRVKLNYAGFRALRLSPGVDADLQARGRRIMSAAGPGYTMDSWPGRTRRRVTVATDTPKTMARNQRAGGGAPLLRALGAGR